MKKIAFRMDDIGASSKIYEVYGKGLPIFCNFLFLKYIKPFKKWGRYNEITAETWREIFKLLRNYNIRMTLAITAGWVERDNQITPFPEKFPKQAKLIKEAFKQGLVEVANHGLTHCVVGEHLPKLFSSNRKYHREFWPWVSKKIHQEHLEKSQQILEDFFEERIVTFVPSASVWTKETEKYAAACGIKYLSAKEELCPSGKISNNIQYIGETNIFVFHDRDIVLSGIDWLEEKIKKYLQKYQKICRVRDLIKE